jgi:hypothetical protein
MELIFINFLKNFFNAFKSCCNALLRVLYNFLVKLLHYAKPVCQRIGKNKSFLRIFNPTKKAAYTFRKFVIFILYLSYLRFQSSTIRTRIFSKIEKIKLYLRQYPVLYYALSTIFNFISVVFVTTRFFLKKIYIFL